LRDELRLLYSLVEHMVINTSFCVGLEVIWHKHDWDVDMTQLRNLNRRNHTASIFCFSKYNFKHKKACIKQSILCVKGTLQ